MAVSASEFDSEDVHDKECRELAHSENSKKYNYKNFEKFSRRFRDIRDSFRRLRQDPGTIKSSRVSEARGELFRGSRTTCSQAPAFATPENTTEMLQNESPKSKNIFAQEKLLRH